jgi:transcriptional regulator with XRE-family HTH domain
MERTMTEVNSSRGQGAAQLSEWERVLNLGLAKLRKARGWTQVDLAQRSGLHRRTIYRLEQQAVGTIHPSLQTIIALARAFGYVHLSDLWTVLQEVVATDPGVPLVVGERVRKMILAFLDCSPRQQQLFEGMITACAALQQRDASWEEQQLLQWLFTELQPKHG